MEWVVAGILIVVALAVLWFAAFALMKRSRYSRLLQKYGGDEKLVCVPDNKTFPYYHNVDEKDDLPGIVMEQIEHFFTHYKDLEKQKWVRIGTWGGAEDARRITLEAIERYKAGK